MTVTTADVRKKHRPGFGHTASNYGGNDVSGFLPPRVQAIPKAAPRWLELGDGTRAQFWCEGKGSEFYLPGPVTAHAVYLTEHGTFITHRWK